MLVKYESEMVVKAMQVGWEKQFRPRPVAVAEMLDSHLLYDEWLFIPRDQDSSIIPKEAERRVEALRVAGIPIVGEIVAHEAPKLLPAPAEPAIDWDEVKEKAKKGVMATAVAALAVTTAVALAFGYILVAGLTGLVMLDPALIAVVEDPDTGEHYWLEVARWRE
jgi:hypothetical protein